MKPYRQTKKADNNLVIDVGIGEKLISIRENESDEEIGMEYAPIVVDGTK